ncbi:MAG: peptidoglycan bridge formation glycyltransferase FemA/FemB family protein, partial [Pseudorhodobacter sp.]|nr:peptidoglycan bridge formation glycyltransferase FemA/FemB family protein [Pseudorhodobacter sp.]
TYALASAQRIGARAQFVVVEQAGRAVAAAALRIKHVPGLGRGIAWCPAGPLLVPKQGLNADLGLILQALRQAVHRDGHILRLRLSGLALQNADQVRTTAAAAGFAPTGRASLYRSTAMDLRLAEPVLLQRLDGKWRTDLRYALKSGLGLDQGNNAALQARFLALYRSVQTAKGFAPDISPEFHFALPGPDYALDILIATKDGQDLGGVVVGSTGQSATYLFGATAEAGRPLRAGYFLTWAGMTLARARGLDWYDMGGIDREANPDVARFKDRMNGVPILCEAFEARPAGLIPPLIAALETLRSRIKQRRKAGP